MCARAHRQGAGFTLVELMIALGLTSLVTVALLAAAQVQSGLQRQENQAQQTQDNVRSALEELVSSIRRAGTPFISEVATNAVPPGVPAIIPAIQVINNTLGAAAGDSPDSLQLILGDDTVISTLVQDASQNTNPLVVDNAPSLHNQDFVVLTDFNNAVLYRLLQDPAASSLQGIPTQNLTITPPPVAPPAPFVKGALVVRAKLISYQIDRTIFKGTPVLTLQDGAPLDVTSAPQIVAENIEDVQIAVGVDGLNSGIQDGVVQEIGAAAGDDEWVYNFPGETLPSPLPPGARIAALRISVIGRTTQTTDQRGPGRPAVEDRPAGPPDGYRWRVLTAQVSLRNIATN